MNAKTADWKPIRVYLVDDHTVVRQGTRELLLADPQFDIVGESGCGQGLMPSLEQSQPDILLLDINLSGDSGLTLLETIRPQFSKLKILMFSAYAERQYVRRALALGANGYLCKTISDIDLRRFLRQATESGQTVLSADIAALNVDQPVAFGVEGARITARERETLLLIAQGHTNREIAQRLILSVKTVDHHIASLMKKLEIHNRSQLTAYAYNQGWM